MLRQWMASVWMVALATSAHAQHPSPPPRLEKHAAQISRALAHARAQLLTPHDEALPTSVVVDPDGAEHVRFDRVHRGLRVIGGDFVIHSRRDGALEKVSATLKEGLGALSLTPRLTAEQARLAAKKEASLTGNLTTTLVILAHHRAPALAYDVFSDDPSIPQALHLLVDARTGALLDKWDDIHTGAAIGTGRTLYSGTVALSTNSIVGGYEMRDVTRGFYTLDVGAGSIFTDADNLWGNFTNGDRATAGADAHFGHMMAYDYFKNIHGRNGIDGAGNAGYSRVHYGTSYVNAFWSDGCFCMTYGDGDNVQAGPLVSLDVAGHELTHGVTRTSANLIYSGESGGLNEATSDIFGSMVEHYANNASDPGDYLIGEEIWTPARSGDALRYMHNPSKDGQSANCWFPGLGALDVHYSSGVANHFFYLLAVGSNGSPASPTCNGATVAGIGRAAAEKIWYRALTVYFTSSTSYSEARAATLDAARDLFGLGSVQYNAVAAAWSAVSVS